MPLVKLTRYLLLSSLLGLLPGFSAVSTKRARQTGAKGSHIISSLAAIDGYLCSAIIPGPLIYAGLRV